MKTFLSEIRSAALAALALATVCCGLYPLLVFGLGQLLFPGEANGSLIVAADGTVSGTPLLGQAFTGENYFHPRPSAAGNGYDATASGGSNLGPTSQRLRDRIEQDLAAYRSENNLPPNAPVPADAVTASASGLDPHISPANAEHQAARVARARRLDPEHLRRIIRQSTDFPEFGFFGEPGVNVLKLNLALDHP